MFENQIENKPLSDGEKLARLLDAIGVMKGHYYHSQGGDWHVANKLRENLFALVEELSNV